ncbi:hypothetical protein NEFER03_2075 [Nematocida sp. LUAm3]|nr:hypothetical protein NEFER03_2075 [Nematocida sp. LUAm3]KAI5176207.1 hypothetical protein NEFER02_2013 [Nematocida sp. LUAm2]KAI5179195.1 hypothetical protein NEFER01_2052 [Nematocida sp. LUAm1]
MKGLKGSPHSTEFVDKLYKMLEDPLNQSLIQWCPSGASFIITNPIEFGKTILHRHFKHGNLSSFVRQLNKYDFHKIKSVESILKQFGMQVWEFKHSCFQKGRLDILKHITRKKSNADKRFKTSREMSSDSLEVSNRIQSQIIGTLKMLTVHFQVLVEEVNDLKKTMNKKGTLFNHNVTVLVAEDNVTCSSYAGAILKKIGCITEIVEGDTSVMHKLSEKKYDIVFISKILPTAQKIVEAFRQFDNSTPIIITADEMIQERCISLINAGASDILVKPYHQETLIQVMMKYCYSLVNSPSARNMDIHKGKHQNIWQ